MPFTSPRWASTHTLTKAIGNSSIQINGNKGGSGIRKPRSKNISHKPYVNLTLRLYNMDTVKKRREGLFL